MLAIAQIFEQCQNFSVYDGLVPEVFWRSRTIKICFDSSSGGEKAGRNQLLLYVICLFDVMS